MKKIQTKMFKKEETFQNREISRKQKNSKYSPKNCKKSNKL